MVSEFPAPAIGNNTNEICVLFNNAIKTLEALTVRQDLLQQLRKGSARTLWTAG
ncbi:unnamed protein product [Larinioides sclopetarius]|uniref:Uncharacterized protein n=1 Tax=Larinioides sclopetarius TaxID=280406 RepID=A0AAV2B7R7_9ARAC